MKSGRIVLALPVVPSRLRFEGKREAGRPVWDCGKTHLPCVLLIEDAYHSVIVEP